MPHPAQSKVEDILEYRAALQLNREVFLLNYPYFFYAFRGIDANFLKIVNIVAHQRDNHGHAHVSFVPFLLLMQRQARHAFEALCSHQAYGAWVLVRPAIEAALMIGKWVDSPRNAGIWKNRLEDPKAYQKAYSGKKLRSRSLPRSDSIQRVLSMINDRYVHANPEYYYRHVVAEHLDEAHFGLLLNYFDDDVEVKGHAFAFLHLLILIQDSMLEMLRTLFPSAKQESMGLSEFEKELSTKAREHLQEVPDARSVIEEFGLWSDVT